jgi:hypothetical protein
MNLAAAEAKYQSAVRRAMREAQSVVSAFASADLTSIDATALRQRATWAGQDWDWTVELGRFASDPRRLSLAIWSGSVLCGLATGKVAKSGKHVSITLMEGNPDEAHPLKGLIAKIVMLFGLALCVELGAAELRFVNPLDALVPLYEGYGFSLEASSGGVPYMAKKVRQ